MQSDVWSASHWRWWPRHLTQLQLTSAQDRCEARLVARKAAHVGDHIGNVVGRKGPLKGGHVAALAKGGTALRDNARHIVIIEQLRVALPVQGADVGHENLAATAAVDTMATRAIALVHGLAAFGVSRPSQGGDQQAADGGG